MRSPSVYNHAYSRYCASCPHNSSGSVDPQAQAPGPVIIQSSHARRTAKITWLFDRRARFVGAWKLLAKGIAIRVGQPPESRNRKASHTTLALTLRFARPAGIIMNELLAGQRLSLRCPHTCRRTASTDSFSNVAERVGLEPGPSRASLFSRQMSAPFRPHAPETNSPAPALRAGRAA